MQLILLAAGRGTRLPKKYRNKPKCLAKINNKTILDYNIDFFNLFKKKHIISGYKSNHLKSFAKKNKFKIIKNKEFKSTNMTHSLFLSKKHINDDLVVCYGDIIFDKLIYNFFDDHKNIIPVNVNWFKLWKKRMNLKEIKNDAENLIIKNNQIISIGGKISKKIPKFQYMGIFKLKKKDFFKMEKLYKKIKNKKIDMTSFLDRTIKSTDIKFIPKKYKNIWFEIDNASDINVASKLLK